MPLDKLENLLLADLEQRLAAGSLKGRESVITDVVGACGTRGPRYRLEGFGTRDFIRMNSNGYLGMALRPELRAAAEAAARRFGLGPGAVRFISGTYQTHLDLEARLARFHGKEAAILFSSAYGAVVGILAVLTTGDTLVLSDALNHNCIINGIRLGQPAAKQVYPHNDVQALADLLAQAAGRYARVLIVTDGVFSMRGDHAPLEVIADLAQRYQSEFAEGVLTLVDDSHGVGAFGATGRGTLEVTGAAGIDILVATMGKALGVNGGYAAASAALVAYLRETVPFYVYSNPISASEAAAVIAALDLLDSQAGRDLLQRLAANTARFREGLRALGFEVIPGRHPVVPLLVRDTARTVALVDHLRAHGILATAITYPVVPRGEEEIRFQVSADHTPADLDEVLAALGTFREACGPE